MRTTLTIDDDLLRALKELAHRHDRTFKDVINDTLRRGLAVQAERPRKKRYRLTPASLGGVRPGFDLDRALAIADDLENEELARKLDMNK